MDIKKLKKEMSGKYGNYIYFIIIGILFLFTRLYRITSLPEGMHIDEVSMGYNTWSLTEYGTDRYGESWPVYFNNAGSGQSSLYVYLAVILSKLLGGYSILSLRLVAVLFGIILLVFGTKVAYELKGMTCAKVMAFILTIMPFFIMSERWAFDCNALLPILTMALYFFIRLLKTKDKRYAIFSGISFALALYSYILAFIIVPVFLVLALIYAIGTKRISIKNILLMVLSGFICAVPIILFIFVILGIISPLHIGPISITDASSGRLSELAWQGYSIPELYDQLCNLLTYDKYTFTADKNYGTFYLNNLYLFGFKFSLMQVLVFGCILAMIGICIYRIVKKKSCLEILVIFYLVASLVPMLFLEQFAIYRFNATFFAFAFALAYVYTILWKKGAVIVCGIFCTLFVFNFYEYNTYLFQGKFAEEHAALDYFDKELIINSYSNPYGLA